MKPGSDNPAAWQYIPRVPTLETSNKLTKKNLERIPQFVYAGRHSSHVNLGYVPIQSMHANYACFSMQFEVADVITLR